MGERQYIWTQVTSFKKDVRFDIFTAVLFNIPAYWKVMSHPLVIITDASKGPAATIFRV
jgi:hypothetical protein